MTTQAEVFNQLKEILVDQLDVDVDKIMLATNFKNDLELDSLDVFEVIDHIEDTYDIEIDADTDSGLETVGGLVDYILKATAK